MRWSGKARNAKTVIIIEPVAHSAGHSIGGLMRSLARILRGLAYWMRGRPGRALASCLSAGVMVVVMVLTLILWRATVSRQTRTQPPAFVPKTRDRNTAAPGASECGTERWAVKTLSDPFAGAIDLHVITKTTIADLQARPAQQSSGSSERLSPDETTVYELSGIAREVKLEADRDFHLVLEDPNALGTTMIIEIVDPTCNGARDSLHREALTEVRRAFLTLVRSGQQYDLPQIIGRRIRVRGLGFYDLPHAQSGRAHNNLELHPVTFLALD